MSRNSVDTYIDNQFPDNNQQLIKPLNARNVVKKLLLDSFNLADDDSDDINEGSTNLFFTLERVADAIAMVIQDSGDGSLTWTYDDTNNTFTPTVSVAGGGVSFFRCEAAATTNIDTATTGFGDSIDGVTIAAGYYLLAGQTDLGENGIYQAGPSSMTKLTIDDSDLLNTIVLVFNGTVNENSIWVVKTISAGPEYHFEKMGGSGTAFDPTTAQIGDITPTNTAIADNDTVTVFAGKAQGQIDATIKVDGNSPSTTLVLGTSSNQDLSIKTNNVTRLTVSKTGEFTIVPFSTAGFVTNDTTGKLISRTITKSDLDDQFDFKGLVINEDFNSSFSNYTSAGSASWSIVSNMLQAAGGTTFTLSDYVRHSGWGSTCVGNWSAVAEVVVGTIGANTHGVGISFQSTASVNKSNHFVLRLNTANQGQLGSYIDNSTGLISGVDYSLLSTTNLTVAAGDRVRLRLDVIQNEYIFTVTNLTQTSVQPVTITRTAVATGPTSYTNYNTGQFALNICGGTHSFDLHQVTINEVVGADVAFVGDSITRGAGASSKENSYPLLFQKMTNSKVLVWSGGGNRTADLIGADVARYSPSVVVIAAGVNDIIASRTNAQIVTDINAFITALGAGYVLGTNVFVSEVLPYSTASAAIISLNSHLFTTYGSSLIRNYKAFDNGSGGMKTELVTGDLLHPSDDGHRVLTDLYYKFLIEMGLANPSFNPVSGNTAAYKNAGFLALGKQTFTPAYPLHAIDSVYGAGFGSDPANVMYGGSINASSAFMVMQHGAYTNAAGTDAISTNATGNFQMNIANGNFNLRNKSGVAVGSTVLPWNVRINLNLAGNIQIGASNDDSWRVTSAGASSTMRFIVEGAGINSRTASGVTSIGLTEVGFHGFVSNATDRIRITAINTLAFSSTPGSEAGELAFFTKTTTAAVAERMRITHTGNIGIGVIAPTAVLHLKAGTATASTAPFKYTAGPVLTVVEPGACEFDGTNYFVSTSVRYTLAKTLTVTAALDFPSTAPSSSSDLTVVLTGAALGDNVSLGVPNGSVFANSCYTAWVSAADTITVRFNNYDPANTRDPASNTFRVSVDKY